MYIYDMVKGNKEILIIYNYLCKLHEKYMRDVSITELSLYVLVNCMEKDRDNLSALLKALDTVDESSVIFDDLLLESQQKQRAYDLALLALEVSEGRKDYSDLLVSTKDLSSTKSDCVVSESMFVTNDLEVLLNDSQITTGLRWRLKDLNRSLGSLRKGDFGFFFARPETGKTTFLSSEITNFAEQIERASKTSGDSYGPILWFNNEEGGNKVQIKLYQSMLDVTLTELHAGMDKYKTQYLEMGGKHIHVYDSAAIHRKQVEMLAEQLRPSCMVFDQLDKIKGFTDDREDLRLGAIYIWARELAKGYCPVIGVSQSDATGEGKKWLNMDNVANAKTAKQAEADFLVGIGKTHNVAEEEERFFSICKNKLIGDIDSVPAMRHGKIVARIIPERGRYGDM